MGKPVPITKSGDERKKYVISPEHREKKALVNIENLKGVPQPKYKKPKLYYEIQKYAREYSREAIDKLVEIMRGDVKNVRPRDMLSAAQILLERAWGKPVQPVEGEIETTPVRLNFENLTTEELKIVAKVFSTGKSAGNADAGSASGDDSVERS